MNHKRFFERLLGGMSIQRFLRDYWQRKPLYVKNAIDPEWLALAPGELFALAADETVESRLVQRKGKSWVLGHGPFPELPKSRRDWTVLVQGVNLHDDRADRLMNQFRFLPHARLDDVMISYAADRGGVGPHFDSYDVFLLQGLGTRQWKISTQSDLELIPGFPLKILANFTPGQEFVCEPGDLLYLPPQCAHDGVADGPCMTWSMGCRTPPHDELLREYLMHIADQTDLAGRYADPGLTVPRSPAQIPERMIDTLEKLVRRLPHPRAGLSEFIGSYLSEPKATTYFDAPVRPLTPARFDKTACEHGLVADRRSQFLHDRRRVYANGDAMVATAAEGRVLRKFADRRLLAPHDFVSAPQAVRELFYDWYRDGWIRLDRAEKG